MNNGHTWAKLTEHQLAMAAADLRNAALVVKHAGHFQGALVAAQSGACCSVGAIELATYKKLYGSSAFSSSVAYTEHLDAGVYRADNAIQALAATIPDSLCDECEDDTREPFAIVVHYNDVHCVTPQLAVNMLRLAAANAENEAIARRKALVSA
jgi:hypothetical protein